MSYPWLKKNPFMSLWLSTANRIAGSLRGHATAQAKRQGKAAATKATRDGIKRWSDAVAPSTSRPKRKR